MRVFIIAVVLAGCVDHRAADERNWLRIKKNADDAAVCIKAGGVPHQNFWTEAVESCLVPIEKLRTP